MSWVGNQCSMVVHHVSCESAEAMHPLNAVDFDELYDALHQEYRVCEFCLGSAGERQVAFNASSARRRSVRESYFGACLCCGETRGVQRAHIIPRVSGGVKTMPLCPSCHWNYDNYLMSNDERESVLRWVAKHCSGHLNYVRGRFDEQGDTP